MKFSSNTGFKWKWREGFLEECISDLDIWDEHGCRVSCKGLKILEDDFRAV